jgi:hypothetical protein
MSSDWNGASRDTRADVNRDVSAPMQKVSELADELKRQATGVTEDVTRQVKEQASHLAENAKDVASGTGDKLRHAVEDQKNAGADFVSGIAGAVRRAAGEFDGQIPQAGDYIRRAAEQIDGASEALRQRDLSQLLQGAQDFARRQPTFFLGATVLAGFVAVRFLKSSKPHQPAAGRDSSTYRSENERRLAGPASRWPAEQRM